MARIQRYGLKFPTTIKSGKTLFDLNETRADSVKSQLIHLIFTPEGQKLRDPLFGTKLIQYIFNPNDSQTFSDITMEINDKVKKYVSNCNIEDVSVSDFDDGRGANVKVKYSLIEKDGSKHMYELEQTIM